MNGSKSGDGLAQDGVLHEKGRSSQRVEHKAKQPVNMRFTKKEGFIEEVVFRETKLNRRIEFRRVGLDGMVDMRRVELTYIH